MSRHILVISQYFYPEQFRINDISREWVKKGYKVTVITGIPNYPQGKFYEGYNLFKRTRENINGIEVVRIPLIPRGSNAIMLSLNYLSFVISGYFWSIFTKIKADTVFIFEVSPMTQALPGVWYAKKRKLPCYLYVQDLWPENVEIITGISNKKIINLIGRMVDYIYKNCTKIFTTSKSFIDAIGERGVPKEKIEFWPQYAEDFYQPITSFTENEISSNNELFNIVFTGNIGEAQGLEILPRVAEILREQGYRRFCFHIIGEGRFKKDLLRLVSSKQVEKMFQFIPRQPAEKIPEYLAASDVAFLGLANNPLFDKTIPAKLQSYFACGIPVIASASGETHAIIEQSHAGLCSAPGDAEALAKNIITMMKKTKNELAILGENAQKYYTLNYEKKILLNQMDLYLNSTRSGDE